MPDDGNLLPSLDGASQSQRTHRAAQRACDDIPRISEPDEVPFWNSQHSRKKSIQADIYACQGDDGEFISKFRRMQSSSRIAGQSPVVCSYDGFEKAHNDRSTPRPKSNL
jgi:hypothetical protein